MSTDLHSVPDCSVAALAVPHGIPLDASEKQLWVGRPLQTDDEKQLLWQYPIAMVIGLACAGGSSPRGRPVPGCFGM